MAETASEFFIDLPDEGATGRLAQDVAMRLAAGDVVALSGGLGAGKTTLARALIRTLAGDPDLEVPSPTFTLAQTYVVPGFAVTHIDLYRIGDPAELDELGLIDAVEAGMALVEWPENAGDRLPAARLTIELAMAGAGRRARLSGDPAILARVLRARAAGDFIAAAGFGGAPRRRLAGDASSRAYERVASAPAAILMDWPADGQLDPGDPRRRFRARDVSAFLAVDEALAAAGLSVPRIFAADRSAGFLLMEDFGDETIAAGDSPVPERYAVAVEALASLHAAPRPPALPIPGGGTHALPRFSGDALLAELTLFADWYAPSVRGRPLASVDWQEFLAIWQTLDSHLAHSEQSWTLFDVQSSNLFWLPGRAGIARVGFIDFQDMFLGPAAYDVASLAFDARVDVSVPLRADLVARYIAARQTRDPAFAVNSFRTAFAICGAVRTMKNMGAFARFAAAGKSQYVRHLTRLSGYLAQALAHPVLSPAALWYERHLSS